MERQIRGPNAPPVVLIVVDQPVLAGVIRLALGHAHLQSVIASTAADAMAGLAHLPHLAVVDADLEDGAIVERMKNVTADSTELPVIALTRRGDLQTKLAAFAQGVDDIMTVPFSPEELVARILAILRRTYGAAAEFTPVIRLGELEIDIMRRSVTSGGHELRLTSLEQSLLYLLAANAGRLLTRDEILDHLWGVDYAAESNVVDRHVRNLRAKLQNDWRRPRYIATVPGKGYRFIPTEAPDTAPLSLPL
jgi:DNA-binding response OmpR family regulator